MKEFFAAAMAFALLAACQGSESPKNEPTGGEVSARSSSNSQVASAQEDGIENPEDEELSVHETCLSYSELAASIMGARQRGVPMSRMMKIADGDKMTEAMLIDAYDRPRMNLEENQLEMTRDFENQIYLACTKNLRGVE